MTVDRLAVRSGVKLMRFLEGRTDRHSLRRATLPTGPTGPACNNMKGSVVFDDAAPFLKPTNDLVIRGVDVYVAGVDDQIAEGRTLMLQEPTPGRWVGRIDTDLQAYAAVRLELRLPPNVVPSVVEFVVGPRVRKETLVWGIGPTPASK